MRRLSFLANVLGVVLGASLALPLLSAIGRADTGYTGGGGASFPLLSPTLGTAGAVEYGYSGNLGTGLFFPNANQWGLSDNGTSVLQGSGSNIVLPQSGEQILMNGTGGGLFWQSTGIEILSPASNDVYIIGSGQHGLLHGAGYLVTAKTSNYSLNNTTDIRGVFSNSGAAGTVIFTLPSPAVGQEFTFTVMTAQVLEVLASGSAKIQVVGTLGAANGNTQASTVGNTIRLVCVSSSLWMAIAVNGTWTTV